MSMNKMSVNRTTRNDALSEEMLLIRQPASEHSPDRHCDRPAGPAPFLLGRGGGHNNRSKRAKRKKEPFKRCFSSSENVQTSDTYVNVQESDSCVNISVDDRAAVFSAGVERGPQGVRVNVLEM